MFFNTSLQSNAVVSDGNLFAIGRYELIMTYADFVVDGIVFVMYSPENNSWSELSGSGNNAPMSGFLDEGRIFAIAINETDIYVGK